MRTLEMKGKTVEEAKEKALLELGLTEKEVLVEILDRGEAGSFLGIGRRAALVRVSEKENHQDREEIDMSSSSSENFGEKLGEKVKNLTDSILGRDDEDWSQSSQLEHLGAEHSEVADQHFTNQNFLAFESGVEPQHYHDHFSNAVVNEFNDQGEKHLYEAHQEQVERQELNEDQSSSLETQDEVKSVHADAERQFNQKRRERSQRERLHSEDAGQAVEFVKNYIQKVLDLMHNDAEIYVHENERSLEVSIEGDDCGLLIGRRGETLQALQYLCSLAMVKATGSKKRLHLDIGGYYSRRRHTLISLARRTAERALKSKTAFELNPMKSSERRIVHEVLQQYKGIVTYSEGDEPNRYVVIDLADED